MVIENKNTTIDHEAIVKVKIKAKVEVKAKVKAKAHHLVRVVVWIPLLDRVLEPLEPLKLVVTYQVQVQV